jgi:tetratricopeptide (TPR) repeat protein
VEGWSGEQAYFFAKIATDLMEAGQLAAAEKMFSALNALNPEDWFFPYCLAQIARQRGEMDRAIDYLDEAACNGPDRPEPLLLRSLCHLAVRNVEEARQDLRRVTELSTDSTNQEISKMAGVAEAMMERLEVSA